MATKKKLPPITDWEMDFGFWSYAVKVKARTALEARKKAMAKLRATNPSKFINKKTTYLEKKG